MSREVPRLLDNGVRLHFPGDRSRLSPRNRMMFELAEALTGGFKVSFGIAHLLADAALDIAIAYAKERQSFGQPIIQHQAVGHQVKAPAKHVEQGHAGRSVRPEHAQHPPAHDGGRQAQGQEQQAIEHPAPPATAAARPGRHDHGHGQADQHSEQGQAGAQPERFEFEIGHGSSFGWISYCGGSRGRLAGATPGLHGMCIPSQAPTKQGELQEIPHELN